MSRYYHNHTTIHSKEKFSKDDILTVQDIYDDLWGKDGLSDYILTKNGLAVSLDGENSLCGGESESEAHNRFVKAFRKAFPDCGIETIWTCLEDLPYETYITEPGEEIT